MVDNKLQSIVDSIEVLEVRQQALLAEKRAIYAEAKNADVNPKALRRIVAERRMKDREQFEADMRAMRIALGMAVNDVANGASLRKAAAKHGISKSALHRAVPHEEKLELGHPAEGGSVRREVASKRGVRKSTQHAVPNDEKPELGQPADDGLELPAHLDRRSAPPFS